MTHQGDCYCPRLLNLMVQSHCVMQLMSYVSIALLILCSKLSSCNSKSHTEKRFRDTVKPVECSLDAHQCIPAICMTQIMLRLQMPVCAMNYVKMIKSAYRQKNIRSLRWKASMYFKFIYTASNCNFCCSLQQLYLLLK